MIRRYPQSANTLSESSTTCEYDRITREVTRTTVLYFSKAALRKALGALHVRWSRWERSASIEANRIMPSGICASIEPSEYNE